MSDETTRDRDDASTADEAADKVSDAASGSDAERMDLPKWNRARVKRKQVKGEETDAFQDNVRKAGKAALTKAPVVIGLIVVVAGLIATVVWYRGKRAEDAATATRVLASASGTAVRGRVGDVEDAAKKKLPPPNPVFADDAAKQQASDKVLGELAAELGDTEANTVAELVRGAAQMRAGDFAAAQASYQAFITGNADHELTFLAREGLALALEAGGDVPAAVAELDTLAGSEGAFYRDQALFQKGRMLESQGKSDEALTTYKTYVEEYPLDKDSLAKELIVARLEELAPELVPETAKPNPFGPGGMGLPPGLGG